MKSIGDREQNLFNAIDTLAQFYDEIDSFMDILFREMGKAGYTTKAERLRPGTFTVSNLPRRLLGTAMVLYVKGVGDQEEVTGEEEEEEGEGEVAEKIIKAEIAIVKGLKIPFTNIWLFDHKSVPSVATLSSPLLIVGAIGDIRFIEKRSGQPVELDSPMLSLSNLVQLPVRPNDKPGRAVRVNCWRPKSMRRYRMEAKLIRFETQPLLEMDSQEKIKAIAEKLAGFCNT